MFSFTEMRYQLFRNRIRCVLLMLVAALLMGSMAFYLGNIQSNRQALNNLSDTMPVTARIVDLSGSSYSQINIETDMLDKFLGTRVHDAVYTIDAEGLLTQESRDRGLGYIGDTLITGANTLQAVTGLKEENITFAPGYDGSFLESSDPKCLISAGYAKQYGFEIGDTVALPVCSIAYNDYGTAIMSLGLEPMDEQEIEVVGTFSASSGMKDMIVPVGWLRKLSDAADKGVLYSSCSGVLDDAMDMNAYKEELVKLFLEPFPEAQDHYSGIAVSVEDELFIKTAGELRENLASFESFLLPFFFMAVSLAALATFLILRSSRQDIAIAASLGRTKLQSGLIHFGAVLLTDLIGCVIALPIMLLATDIGIVQILIILAQFLLVSALSAVLALVCLLRFDTLALLTKVD